MHFIGDAHRRAISLDESARLVAGVFSRNAEKSKKMGKFCILKRSVAIKIMKRWHWRKRKGKTALILFVVVTPNASHYEICKAF